MNVNKKLFDVYGGWEKKYREQAGDAEAWSSDPQPWVLEKVKSIHKSGQRPAVVADLGSGDGRNTKVLLEAGHLVTAVDISPTGQQAPQSRLFASQRLLRPFSKASQ